MFATRFARAALVAAAALVSGACGGGGDTSVAPPGGFSVSLSATSVAVNAGSSGSLTATIARTGSFSGTVSLSTENVPAGLTASFAPSEITAGTTSTTLSVAAAASLAPGAYTFVVRGKAASLTDQTATVSVTVSPQPNVTLTMSPDSLTIQAGAGSSALVILKRTNFTGSVALSMEGAPAGVSGNFSVSSLSTDSAALVLSTSRTTIPGKYPLVVRGKSSLADCVDTLTILVTPPPDFTIALSPSALTVQQGASGSVSISVSRSGGMASTVAFALENLPAGVTGTVTASTTSADSATLTIGASLSATPQIVAVTVHGLVSGVADRTATLSLTITPYPGAIALSLAPTTLSLPQGATGAIVATIARTAPFAGAVALAVTGLPAGLTSTISSGAIASGSTSAQLSLTAAATLATGSYSVVVHATGSGVSEKTATLAITVTATPTSLIEQHLLVQEGLAIAMASTVLQSQIRIAFAVGEGGPQQPTACEALSGGGSLQTLPIGANNPTKVGIYFDNQCSKPYVLADVTKRVQQPNGQIDFTETATYFGPTGTSLGTMEFQETAQLSTNDADYVAGLGTFTPQNGGAPVHLGLTCTFPTDDTQPLPCAGGIEQNVPSLGRDIGSVSVLSIHGTDENSPVTFTGNNSVLTTGAIGSLTLRLATATTLAIGGGTTWGASTQSGSAGNFALFPPTPTGWTVTDAAHDMQFTIQVVSNTVRNLTGTVKEISTGRVLTTFALDQSGTGTLTWSDGTTVAVTNWLFAN